MPGFISGDFTGFVVDQDELHLRAVKLLRIGDRVLSVISDIPITPELLQPTAARLGAVTLLPLPRLAKTVRAQRKVDAGLVPPLAPSGSTLCCASGTLFDVVDWQTGKKQASGIGMSSPGRPCCTRPCSPPWVTSR